MIIREIRVIRGQKNNPLNPFHPWSENGKRNNNIKTNKDYDKET